MIKKNWFLFCCFFIVPLISSFGQDTDTLNQYSKKHFVFSNILHLVDPSGATLQFGLNYQCKSWLDVQLELGFTSDNLSETTVPFQEYVGFRIRPQIRFSNKKRVNKVVRPYAGLILSYQQLSFKENNDFDIGNFFQNITYSGLDKTYAWYLIGGLDAKSRKRFIASFSIGLGQVWINTKADEGTIPDNATIINDCVLFCRRSDTVDREFNRPGILAEIRLGYMF